ncbi:MAG: hypothetical protein NTZ35_00110, partial [Ignavibacteriales bacterium]|nr:hypothetical protein [Ignavibacteriales bacterium]
MPRSFRLTLVLVAFVIGLAQSAHAQLDNIWTGTTSTNWSIASNWSRGSIPTNADNVRIPRAAILPSLTAASVARTITFIDSLSASASATLTMAANTLTVGVAGFAGDITLNNVGAITATTGTISLTIGGSLTINSGGSVTFTGAGAININGNWTNNGGTFTPGTSTVTFNNNTTAQTIGGTAASQTFNNLTINKAAGILLSVGGSTTSLTVNNLTETLGNFTAPATFNVNGNVTLTAGTFTAGTDVNVAGNWSRATAAVFTPGTGTVTFNGGAAQTLNGTSATQTFNNFTVSKGGGTLTVG